MTRTIRAALLLILGLTLTPAVAAQRGVSQAKHQEALATVSVLCSAMLVLQGRRGRGPK